jgi:hypothetical protein
MSVHKSAQALAYSEFERQMIKLHNHTTERAKSLPVRIQKFTNPKLLAPLNRAYTAVVYASEQNVRNAEARVRRQKYLAAAAREIANIQKPLLVICNLKDVTQSSAKRWTEMFNYELSLIWGVAKFFPEEKPVLISYPKNKIKKLKFLNTMCELHRFTYEKIGHAPMYCEDTLSDRIADFIDTALCEVIFANDVFPQTKGEAEEREKHLITATDALNGLQRPLLSLWNIMGYSENIMREWSDLLDSELNLINGLINADSKRYKHLV